jgi:uncharacterized protein involved in type VI secretion and phage assembly
MKFNVYDNKEQIVNSHVFYRAVVEDRDDPEKLNRVRVRVVGVHPENAVNEGNGKGVPVNHLPWAEIASPTLHGGQNAGIGISTVPVKGTWVWVFFDAGDWNRPIVIGTMYGIPTKQGPGKNNPKGGFHDDDIVHPLPNRLNEPDTNRLARNEKVIPDTLIGTVKDANRDYGTPTVTGITWDEPKEHTTKAKYPDNTVIQTISENYIEYDDTKGNSRIHFFHKSGTYFEMRDNGDYSTKITKQKHEIINDNSYKLVKKSEYCTIQKDNELKIDGYQEIDIAGYHKEVIKGTVEQIYKSSKTEKVTGVTNETYSSGQHTNGGPIITIKAGNIFLN